ncbi:8-amino-7-oxononanoate synthase [Halalkalibacterium halodurans]|uniref:8-amino-7-oxononanoate synthase n=1 Tax=Halalkalibacterium halodurans TaxID=86665 RepID=UPI002E1E932A|nr:8-amino-7-oxononanoate synthase [Halalkalibacterium halodurans]MED4172092.1 8-amino-7-oxononanoate synthase [Halalkalibacterium halodurans]
MNADWLHAIEEKLTRLKDRGSFRQLVPTSEAALPWLTRENCRLLNLASNNYLGIADSKEFIERTEQLASSYAIGSTASRLIIGNHPLYEEAEYELTKWKKTEAALIFGSSYMANVGIISSIVGRGDAVFSDKLNHASIVDGCQLSRADHLRFRHNDMDHLETLLQKSPHKQKLIVVDALFSMDGDHANLHDLVTLKERYGAILMVDEAHSGGVYGATGGGLVEELGLNDRVDIQMGTFSKALGSYGGYVAGAKPFIEYLLNHARSLIFTTALPPYIVASHLAALQIVQEQPWRREKVQVLGERLRNGLEQLGFSLCGSESYIVPVLIGDNHDLLLVSESLQAAGIAAIPVRPPTVPRGEGRIRLTVTASHTEKDIDWAIEQFQRLPLVGRRELTP